MRVSVSVQKHVNQACAAITVPILLLYSHSNINVVQP